MLGSSCPFDHGRSPSQRTRPDADVLREIVAVEAELNISRHPLSAVCSHFRHGTVAGAKDYVAGSSKEFQKKIAVALQQIRDQPLSIPEDHLKQVTEIGGVQLVPLFISSVLLTQIEKIIKREMGKESADEAIAPVRAEHPFANFVFALQGRPLLAEIAPHDVAFRFFQNGFGTAVAAISLLWSIIPALCARDRPDLRLSPDLAFAVADRSRQLPRALMFCNQRLLAAFHLLVRVSSEMSSNIKEYDTRHFMMIGQDDQLRVTLKPGTIKAAVDRMIETRSNYFSAPEPTTGCVALPVHSDELDLADFVYDWMLELCKERYFAKLGS